MENRLKKLGWESEALTDGQTQYMLVSPGHFILESREFKDIFNAFKDMDVLIIAPDQDFKEIAYVLDNYFGEGEARQIEGKIRYFEKDEIPVGSESLVTLPGVSPFLVLRNKIRSIPTEMTIISRKIKNSSERFLDNVKRAKEEHDELLSQGVFEDGREDS